MNRATGIIQPVAVMALGAYLGLVNQAATGTSGWLRVPALIASLILVAQAIHEVQQLRSAHGPGARQDQTDVEPTGTDLVAYNPGELEAPGRAVHRDAPVQIRVSNAEAPGGMREKPQTIYVVMGLSVWLGLASLANPGAPRTLLVLSLLAAFLLFSEAWQMLRRLG